MKKLLIGAALAFLSLSSVANAEQIIVVGKSGLPQTQVSFADLNLRHPVGANVMLNRIGFAATRVCGGEPDIVDIGMRRYFKVCVRVAVEDALSQLQAPLVTSMYFERTPTSERFAYQDARGR